MNRSRMAVRIALATSLVLVCLCLVAQAQDVKYNYAQGTDFTKYKTYKWVDVPGGERPDPMLSDQIKAAVDSQLALKGLKKVEGDDADLFIAFQVSVSQEKQWDAIGYGGRYRTMGGMGSMTSSTINIGTLVVDMYDSAQKKQVWRGDATKTLNPSKDPQKNQERLQKAVAKLLKNYPPPVKK